MEIITKESLIALIKKIASNTNEVNQSLGINNFIDTYNNVNRDYVFHHPNLKSTNLYGGKFILKDGVDAKYTEMSAHNFIIINVSFENSPSIYLSTLIHKEEKLSENLEEGYVKTLFGKRHVKVPYWYQEVRVVYELRFGQVKFILEKDEAINLVEEVKSIQEEKLEREKLIHLKKEEAIIKARLFAFGITPHA